MGLRRSTLAAVALLAVTWTAAAGGQSARASKTPDHLVGVWQLNLAEVALLPRPGPDQRNPDLHRARATASSA